MRGEVTCLRYGERRNGCGGERCPVGTRSSGFGVWIHVDTEQDLLGAQNLLFQFSSWVIPAFFLHLLTSCFCGEKRRYLITAYIQGSKVPLCQLAKYLYFLAFEFDTSVCENVVLKVYAWNACIGNSVCVKYIGLRVYSVRTPCKSCAQIQGCWG